MGDVPTLSGVMVTYRRPEQLRTSLELLATQSLRVSPLVVVDNDPTEASRAAVEEGRRQGLTLIHLEMKENLGPAGGLSQGFHFLLPGLDAQDWVVVLNDDFGHQDVSIIEHIRRFADQQLKVDPRTGLVGLCGSRFDRRRGRVSRVPLEELRGAVPVSSVGGGHLGMYRVAALREVGPFVARLFFGFEELELGTRLARNGWSAYAHGDIWRGFRRARPSGPQISLGGQLWRRYYSLRNMIWLLRQDDHPEAALRLSLVHVIKPLLVAPAAPARALRHFTNNLRAIRDGWGNHLGRTVEPSGYS